MNKFLAGMYQKTFNECNLSRKSILQFIYIRQNPTPFSPTGNVNKRIYLLDSRGTVALYAYYLSFKNSILNQNCFFYWGKGGKKEGGNWGVILQLIKYNMIILPWCIDVPTTIICYTTFHQAVSADSFQNC